MKNVRLTLEHLESQLILGIVDGLHGTYLPVENTCDAFIQYISLNHSL